MATSAMTLLPTGRSSLKRWRPSVKRTCLLHLQVTSEQLCLHPMLNSWNTVWAGRAQKLVDDRGVPKGMKKTLEERGVNTDRMKADDMRTVLSFHEDFKNEKTLVDKYITDKGHKCLFLPKFHCEINPTKRVWGQAKVYSRVYTNFMLPGLRSIVNPALDSVSTETVLLIGA